MSIVTLTDPAHQLTEPDPTTTLVNDREDLIASIVEWLDGLAVRCLDERVVPGTTAIERRRLAALGGIVRSIARRKPSAINLPPRVRAWVDSAPRPPQALADRIVRALRWDGPGFLATMYERIVRSSHRRSLGTYFTPQTTVDWMLAEWSAKEGTPEAVVDVGAGVGVFTASAIREWPSSTVFAVDVNPVTLGLLGAVAMSMEPPPHALRLVLQDYTAWRGWKQMAGSCVTIGNPPYTRLQLLPKSARARLKDAVPDCGARAGLSTWILASAFARLRETDGLLLLLPRNWMEADYGTNLRTRLWAASHRRVELTCLDGELFGDARVDAVALLVGAHRPSPQPFVLRDGAASSGYASTDRSGPPPSFVAHRGFTARAPGSRQTRENTRPLSSFGTVRRGVATGANEYFALSDETIRRWSLPPTSSHPLVRRLRDFPRDTIPEADLAALGEHAARWLFLVSETQAARVGAIAAYVRHGEGAGIHDRHLCRQRHPWYDLHCDTTIPDVIVGAMSSSRFRFVENVGRAAITNNLFGFTWAESTSADERVAVLTWLRSGAGQEAVRAACRVQAGGLRKLEPRALGGVRIPLGSVRRSITR